MKKCSVDPSAKIFVRKEHLVCQTACSRILKIRFKNYSMIRPEVSIKYFNCLVRRFGSYRLEKEVVRISKESKLFLERLTKKEIAATGILMPNLKTQTYARLGYTTDNQCCCDNCLESERRTLHIKENSLGGYSAEEFKALINSIKKKEKIKNKIKEQEISYNKYGIRTIRSIYERFFGCYNLKEKRAGIRPFTLKGPWTKDNANRLMHSYKTSMSIKNISFFILIHKNNIPPTAHTITYNNTTVYYTLAIHKIDLKTKTELRQHINNKKHSTAPPQ